MPAAINVRRDFPWTDDAEADLAARSDAFPVEGRAYTWGGINENVVALDAARIAGRLAYGPCLLRDGRGEHQVLGVGGVQVARAYTGRGLARRLLQEVAIIAGERKLPLALFCPDRLRPLYSSVGYVRQTPPTCYVDPAGDRRYLREFNLMTCPDLRLDGPEIELAGLPW